LHVYIYIHIYTYTYTYIYTYIYIYIHIYKHAYIYIYTYIHTNMHLKYRYMRHQFRFNQIGAAGPQSLAGVLGQCPALAHLNLGANVLGDAGAERYGSAGAVHSAGSSRSQLQ
jgi:hypothetical protein